MSDMRTSLILTSGRKGARRIDLQGCTGVVKQFPMFGKGEVLYLWAERGLVHYEYAKTNGYGSMTWDEAGRRVLALSEMIRKPSESYADERLRMQNFVVSMTDVIRKAKAQGGPFTLAETKAINNRRRAIRRAALNTRVAAVDPRAVRGTDVSDLLSRGIQVRA
jgi:hypothetical protein